MALHLYIEKEKIIFALKDDKTSFGKAEAALLSAKHNRLLSKTVKNMDFKEFNERIREQEYGTNDMVLSEAFPALMRKVYLWMTLALAISGIVAYGVATSPNLLYLIYTNQLVFWGLIITELVLVWKISGSIWKENRSLAATTLMFATFAALNGATLSYIFIRFAPTAIIKTFFITSGTFAVTSAYGYFTKKDLSKWGSFLFMALDGLIIALVANIFFKSSMLDFIISIAGVLLFVGLTIWDSQNIKRQLAVAPDMSETSQKIALCGALDLYLDFINLFIYLLRLFGRDN